MIKKLLIIFGLVLILDALIITFVTGPRIANFLTLTAGACFIVPAWFWGAESRLLRTFVNMCGLFLLYFAVMCIFILFTGRTTAAYTENAVIILGAGIKGETVLPGLKSRLDTALKYIEKNPNAIIVVSGGQGPGESISEANAMQRYLIAAGIARERILLENKSRNTQQNLSYSKYVLGEYFGQDKKYKVTVISSRYHLYRAARLTGKEGLDFTLLGAPTPLYLCPPAYMREALSIPYALFKEKFNKN
ncbi:uncharacterized SAM-binding protein YcdF (DUF218 family) [Elusimicrobium simillimum]|uniref:YdcF family protein n=1 Tax=Elusimicrobium simillimum TaxID=3143438 RepID=UPI003C6FD667